MEPFAVELAILLGSPYAYIAIVTHDEARAVAAVMEAAAAQQRPVRQWSWVGGLEGAGPEDLRGMLDALEAEVEPAIFVLKDLHPWLHDPILIRRLRELEPLLTAFGKSVVLVSPMEPRVEELSTDLTILHMPLPGRETLERISQVVFPARRWPELGREGLIQGALGLTSRQALRAFHRVRQEWQRSAELGQGFDPESSMLAEKRRLVQQVDVIQFVESDRSVGEVGGMDELKGWLGERQEAFSERARAFGLPAPKGLLLLGVQGCGKSLMAKAVAHHWSLPLLRLDIATLFGGQREPDAALRMAIRTAEALSPAVLWVDEIEKVFDMESGAGAAELRLLASLLTWMQEKTAPVFFVATANDVTHLPPELLRKGRFDEIFFVDLPDKRARVQILQIHLTLRSRDPGAFDLDGLASAARNFSGAELEQVVIDGLYAAFSQGGELEQRHMERVIDETIPLFRTYEDEIKALREWAQHRTRYANRDSSVLDYFDTARPAPRR